MRADPGIRKRPTDDRAPSSVSDDTKTVPQHALILRRRRWAHALIGKAATPPPSYGSAEWVALPEGSAEKVAGVVVAAECWAVDGDELPERLARELADVRAVDKRVEDEDYLRARVEHRDRWRHLLVVRPRYAGQVVRPLEDIGADMRGMAGGAS